MAQNTPQDQPDEGFLPLHKEWYPLSPHHQSTALADWRCGDAGLAARQTRLLDCAVSGFGSIWPVLGQPLAALMLREQRCQFDFAGTTGAPARPIG